MLFCNCFTAKEDADEITDRTRNSALENDAKAKETTLLVRFIDLDSDEKAVDVAIRVDRNTLTAFTVAAPDERADIILSKLFKIKAEPIEEVARIKETALKATAEAIEIAVLIRATDFSVEAALEEVAVIDRNKDLTLSMVAIATEVAVSVRNTDLRNTATPLEEAVKTLAILFEIKAVAEERKLSK